jgi:hypothetical protein
VEAVEIVVVATAQREWSKQMPANPATHQTAHGTAFRMLCAHITRGLRVNTERLLLAG